MSLRTGLASYKPMPHDQYYTPSRHVRPLLDYAREVGLFDNSREIWECAAGAGHLARGLRDAGYHVFASDLHPPPPSRQLVPIVQSDFLLSGGLSGGRFSIVTNPPYGSQSKLIIAFIRHALWVMSGSLGGIAMLLPFEFDSRKSRNELVGEHPWWCGKITVGERIRWANLPQKKVPPMAHHAWFCWSSDPIVQRRARRAPSMVAR